MDRISERPLFIFGMAAVIGKHAIHLRLTRMQNMINAFHSSIF